MPITEIPAHIVFDTLRTDFGLTKDGRRTKNPFHYDQLPEEIMNAPVEWYIYNVGPSRQVINAGDMGTHYLLPPAKGERYNKPLSIRKFMVVHSNQGDYKMKPMIFNGVDVAREWVTPNGEVETDLRKWGVFATKNNPPSEKELMDAEARLHKTMDALVKIADQYYESGRRKEITPIFVTAAKYMCVERPWCSVSKPMMACPGCFKAVEKEAAKCSACGAVLDWKKARQLRLVSKTEFEEAVADGLVGGPLPIERASKEKGK